MGTHRIGRRSFVVASCGVLLGPLTARARGTATPDSIYSRGLGITLAEFAAIHGAPDADPPANLLGADYSIRDPRGGYHLTLDTDVESRQIQGIEVDFSDAPAPPYATLVITSLLPADSVQTGQVVPDTSTIVLIEHSDWLAASQRTGNRDVPLWPNAHPGDFIVVLSGGTWGIEGALVAFGNDPAHY